MALALTPLVRRVCERLGWLDSPGDVRRVHREAVPRLGGVAVFASVLVALLSLALVNNFVTRSVNASLTQLFETLVPATLIFLFGVYDDLRGTNALAKFVALAVCGTIFYALGGRIELLSAPIFGSLQLPQAVSFVLTLVWIIGVANAFNLIDGVDGLAAGAGLFASLVMLVVALMLGHPLVAVVACALCGALIGFLRYNFNPASIFLGDSGALFIGFVLATLSVHGAQKASTAVAVAIPLLAFGVPVVDTGFTLVRRFIGGRPLFEGDREHIHHMLLARGWSQRRVVYVLYGASALFGLAALFFVQDAGRATGLLLFIVGVAVVLAVGRLRYHEVDEIRASVRRGIGERRLRTANNIHVRRATRAMSEAGNLSELFDAVRVLLELGEFVQARVRIGSGDSGRYWTLHLPLSTERGSWGYINLCRGLEADELLLDINYLCRSFQREMAHAAERILHDAPELVKASATATRDARAYKARA
ncbi:MAG: undecaprenyl/decaprenyl-phosphate alpha-N-acetylglucosaminyl 1-phosphate transferase [Acidobacteria bacterium]|nr:undecaprenyl/decaprenyl-phosphate alpha-N-acetylglucosaminyl 1-phosphate transferase [Acidobacteriota bacterium]